MVTQVSDDLKLAAVGGDTRTLAQWTTTFQLVTVVLDPYTSESAWLLPTAARFLANFREADCRVSFTVAADERDARRFLGPLADEYLTFADPERALIATLGIGRLPALVHIRQDLVVVNQVEGWDPPAWEDAGQLLAKMMSWSWPHLPGPGDPGPFPGSPAAG